MGGSPSPAHPPTGIRGRCGPVVGTGPVLGRFSRGRADRCRRASNPDTLRATFPESLETQKTPPGRFGKELADVWGSTTRRRLQRGSYPYGHRAAFKVGRLPAGEGPLGSQGREEVQGPRDDPGPAGLVARPETGPVVPVEILVEQQ